MAEIRQIQVDGVNYDLVITEDEVSATAAALLWMYRMRLMMRRDT